MKKVLKDKLNILIIFISIFLILLCFNRSLWGDEAWTAIIMKYDFKEMNSVKLVKMYIHLYILCS